MENEDDTVERDDKATDHSSSRALRRKTLRSAAACVANTGRS